MKSFYYMLPLMAGVAIAIQSGVNSQLRLAIQHPLVAAFISFLVGTVALAVMLAFSKDAFPAFNVYGTVSLYKFLGGLLGVFVVYTTLLSVSQIGAANMFMLMIAGQLVAALIMDHFGLMGVPVSPITLRKIAGILFVVAGVYLVKK